MSESTLTSIDAGIAVATAPNHQETAVADAPIETNIKDVPTAQTDPAFLHSPPDSNNMTKSDGSDSELSDLEDEPVLSDPPQPISSGDNGASDENKEKPNDDIGEVLPDHWSGAVPIFKPTMHQFRDFKRFVCRLLVPSFPTTNTHSRWKLSIATV